MNRNITKNNYLSVVIINFELTLPRNMKNETHEKVFKNDINCFKCVNWKENKLHSLNFDFRNGIKFTKKHEHVESTCEKLWLAKTFHEGVWDVEYIWKSCVSRWIKCV